MYLEENEYDSDEENEYTDLNGDIITELIYDKKLNIVNFYKEKLSYEPEFIGIKNISSYMILFIIENTNKYKKLSKKDFKLNFEQYILFTNLYSELNLIGNFDIFNLVTKKIFSKIYV
jgi:hypothetical protein